MLISYAVWIFKSIKVHQILKKIIKVAGSVLIFGASMSVLILLWQTARKYNYVGYIEDTWALLIGASMKKGPRRFCQKPSDNK